MKRYIILLAATIMASTTFAQNPLLEKWDTPFEVPPFSKIKTEHYLEAIKVAMEEQDAEIKAIIDNPAPATFENTIEAYDNSGALIDRVLSVYGCITGTEMTPELVEVQKQVAPLLTVHFSDISLNPILFARIKSVYERRWELGELEARLTDKIYKGFERSGANLTEDKKAELREIDLKLADAQLAFGNNLRSDNNAFVLNLHKKSELKGLGKSQIEAAATEAKKRGLKGYVFTLNSSSLFPFLQYSEVRSLREKMFKGYLMRGNNDNDADNKATLIEIANLRAQRAKLLGYDHHADFVLSRVMAKDVDNVMELLTELWEPALQLAAAELEEMKALPGAPQDFQSWDWWFWAEKLREKKYDLNEEELRPYFALNSVRDGIFKLSEDLFGMQFKEITDIEKYNEENQVFEVFDKDSNHLGVLYMDFHPRAGKRVGAWCTRFRGQSYEEGHRVAPIVSVVCNFTPPAKEGEPALLNLDEVETFFHEFGHAIHSLVSKVPYKGLAGVERDFVELPSQIMENWAFEPQILATYAKHYQTGEVMPTELVDKIKNSGLFNQGFMTVEYLAASLLDMKYHTITDPITIGSEEYEAMVLGEINLIAQIAPRYRSTYFQHIFSGGYSSGYYSYMWSEVLDADAYEAFVETGDLLNAEVAKKFLEEVLMKGGTSDGNTLYFNFRGKEPSKEPLMRKRGLK